MKKEIISYKYILESGIEVAPVSSSFLEKLLYVKYGDNYAIPLRLRPARDENDYPGGSIVYMKGGDKTICQRTRSLLL